MQITVELPDELMLQPGPGRVALEALVIEGYRSEVFSHFEASRLLGFSRFETDGFSKKHEVEEHAYGVDDLAYELMSISAPPSIQQRSS